MQNTICAKTERTVRNVKCRLIPSRKSVARPGGGAAFVSHALSCTEVLSAMRELSNYEQLPPISDRYDRMLCYATSLTHL